MKITAIEKFKKNLYTIYVDDERYFSFDAEVILSLHLKVGQEVDTTILDTAMIKAQRRKTRERAYYLLGYRDHSKKELFDKLVKTSNEDIANEIVNMVYEQGLLDDEKYAANLVNYYFTHNKWGEKRILLELRKKGIEQNTALDAIAQSNVDVITIIKGIIDRKYNIDNYADKQKTIAALLRKGYRYDEISKALANE